MFTYSEMNNFVSEQCKKNCKCQTEEKIDIKAHENNKPKSCQRIIEMIYTRARHEGTSPVDDVIQTASLGHREVLAVIVALDGGLWVEVF